jgi:hypothetical protein
MDNRKYIGMDVHKEAIAIAVLNAAGKLVMESIIETKANTILEFLKGLRGELHRKQQLSLSGGRATQLRRTQYSESYPCLHWDSQTLWWVRPKGAMHQFTAEISCHPHARTGTATR